MMRSSGPSFSSLRLAHLLPVAVAMAWAVLFMGTGALLPGCSDFNHAR